MSFMSQFVRRQDEGPTARNTAAPAVAPGPDCPLAVDLIEFAREAVRRPEGRDAHPLSAHVAGCPYCGPRVEAQVRLHRTEVEPAAEATAAPAKQLPPLDTWSGPLTAPDLLAADAAVGCVWATALAPSSSAGLATHPLYAHILWSVVRPGRVRCQLQVPAEGKGYPSGTPREVLQRLHEHWFMVELTTGDPHRTLGFDTLLQWDDRKAALVSPAVTVSVRDFGQFTGVELTHLQAVAGHDLQ